MRILQEKGREAEMFSLIDIWDVIYNYNGVKQAGKQDDTRIKWY